MIVNKGLTLAGIPEACFRYHLGNRSALEWVIDQYQVSKDARSGIISNPNRLDDPEYIVRLLTGQRRRRSGYNAFFASVHYSGSEEPGPSICSTVASNSSTSKGL
ncbi:MAG TPA: type ISP restriction/modification enzyme [Ktedonobacteraceae bacterium]|nr:type ISP restriction/modification enzyme [Ktedonobacteraceae bacterium]